MAGLALLALLLAAPAPPAHALSMRDLTGWWIAIDDTFPALWERGDMVAMEELLIVNADGRAENRAMNFWSGSSRDCAETKVCSDAPVIAGMRLTLKGDRLSLGDRTAATVRIATAGEAQIRRAAVSSTPAWTASLNGRVLILRSANVSRSFARVEPRRLQRLRAGQRVSQQSAARHWRCLLANATARDPAFAALKPQQPAAADLVEAYLKVASYLAALDSMSVRPTPDDPAGRKFMGHETEEIMVEEFADARLPVTVADSRALRAKIAFVMQKARGAAPEGAPPRLAVSDAEIAAFGRALGDDADAKRLFCRD
jgi:hypothetical protein